QRQRELIGRVTNTVGPFLAFAALERPIPMKRNWSGYRGVGARALALVLYVYGVIKQAPEQEHHLPGQLRVNLIGRPCHGHPRVDTPLASFGLAGQAAKLLPGTHLT